MSRNDDDFGLLRHLDDLLGELHDSVPKAIKEFDADGIHDARVATRRLKAAIGLLEPVLSSSRRKAFENVLKKLRRRLGPLRDLDVMIENLAKLQSKPAQAVASGWLRERLEKRREDARACMNDKSGSADTLAKLGAWWHVREEIEEAREAADTLLGQSLHLQLDAFAERAAGVVRQLAAREAEEEPAERHDPHELRIAGKLLRYTLECAQSQGHDLPSGVLRDFKQMQEALGNWHDDVVLMQQAMQVSLDEMLALHDPAMQEKVLDLGRFLLRLSVRELANFARLWAKRGEAVSRTIRERFPLTAAPTPAEAQAPVPVETVIEPETGPGPVGSDGRSAPEERPPDVASGV
ncbi:MAG TPA: CHAD domain-containing protein [Tepidisphaeraceae bacterium]|jgi:CHAD domain-containing protein